MKQLDKQTQQSAKSSEHINNKPINKQKQTSKTPPENKQQ